jgi:hypothetical protein
MIASDRRRAGFDAHLVKPVDIEHVNDLVQKLVSKNA